MECLRFVALDRVCLRDSRSRPKAGCAAALALLLQKHHRTRRYALSQIRCFEKEIDCKKHSQSISLSKHTLAIFCVSRRILQETQNFVMVWV
jgi:hypothetical protein